jgi:hypothetical protein
MPVERKFNVIRINAGDNSANANKQVVYSGKKIQVKL